MPFNKLEYMKQYNQKNKDKKKEYNERYYEKNQEKLKQQKKIYNQTEQGKNVPQDLFGLYIGEKATIVKPRGKK